MKASHFDLWFRELTMPQLGASGLDSNFRSDRISQVFIQTNRSSIHIEYVSFSTNQVFNVLKQTVFFNI